MTHSAKLLALLDDAIDAAEEGLPHFCGNLPTKARWLTERMERIRAERAALAVEIEVMLAVDDHAGAEESAG